MNGGKILNKLIQVGGCFAIFSLVLFVTFKLFIAGVDGMFESRNLLKLYCFMVGGAIAAAIIIMGATLGMQWWWARWGRGDS